MFYVEVSQIISLSNWTKEQLEERFNDGNARIYSPFKEELIKMIREIAFNNFDPTDVYVWDAESCTKEAIDNTEEELLESIEKFRKLCHVLTICSYNKETKELTITSFDDVFHTSKDLPEQTNKSKIKLLREHLKSYYHYHHSLTPFTSVTPFTNNSDFDSWYKYLREEDDLEPEQAEAIALKAAIAGEYVPYVDRSNLVDFHKEFLKSDYDENLLF